MAGFPQHAARAIALTSLLASAATVNASGIDPGPADHPVEMGHFYTQTGIGLGTGFSIVNERRLGIRMEFFWDEFERLGGVPSFGYPISKVFRWANLNWAQLTQKSLLYWDRFEGRLKPANIYEILSDAGLDDHLAAQGVPPPVKDDGATTFAEAIAIRLGWLENDTLRDAYFANPNPGRVPTWTRDDAIFLNGLPMSRPRRMGPFIAQRFQRTALQLWVEEAPGGEPPGSISRVNAGDIFKEAGLLPNLDLAQPGTPNNVPFDQPGDLRLIFSSQRTGSTQLYMSAPNGGNAMALTVSDNVERYPAISPDGSFVAFARGTRAPAIDQRREPSAGELTLPRIVIRDLVSGKDRTLSPEGIWAGAPSWAPDGGAIVYSGWADGDTDLYIVNVATAANTKLISLPFTQLQPSWSPDGAKIMFASDHDGPFQIYTVRPDGTGVIRITHSGLSELNPRWSPDGDLITFSRSSEFGHDIFVAEPDGSRAANITSRTGSDHSPSFTPDGEFIVYVSERAFDADIYLVTLDGSKSARLVSGDGADRDPMIGSTAARPSRANPVPEAATLLFYSFAASSGPTDIWAGSHIQTPMTPINLTSARWLSVIPGWSPDASRIAFTSSRDGSLDLFIADSDGSRIGQLTNGGPFNGFPDFSPDGMRILFSSNRIDRDDLYIVNVDGSGMFRLTESVGSDVDAVWGTGGDEIVFASDRDGDFDIYRLRFADTRAIQLTNFPGDARNPSISPDGRSIIFSVQSGRLQGIYRMRADGSGLRALIRDGWEYKTPAWSPDGRLIAFSARRSEDATFGIYVMDPVAGVLWLVADTPFNDFHPVWRPGIST